MRSLALAFVVVAGLAVPLRGQEPALVAPAYARATPEYGTADLASVVIGATDILPPGAGVNYTTEGIGSPDGVSRYQTGPSITLPWLRSVQLPNGAIIESVQLDACDTSATGQASFALRRADAPGSGSVYLTPTGGTGVSATPGCAFFSVTPSSPPVVVDNANNTYFLQLSFSDFTGAVKARAFRVYYRLQVSPAPAVATFSDVPTSHQFFRFVEALARSGITAGCGGGQYCPDNSVTRGQMAVFLSVALGLHFPN